MTKKKWSVVFGVGILVLAVIGGVLLKMGLEKQAEDDKYPNRGLPVIEINLDGVSLAEIDGGSKETKYEGNELVVRDSGGVSSYDEVEVKGRGNGTWWGTEKKPYQVKFDEKVDLLGLGRARKWYLITNMYDGAYIRNDVAQYLAGMLGADYGLRGEFVELYIDNEYRGMYYLTRAVEIDKEVVNLKDAWGVLVELDNIYGTDEKYYMSGGGDKLTVKDIVNEDVEEAVMAEFLRMFNRLEVAVDQGDYATMVEVADMESFAEYYLLNEFTANPDAYWTSFYMHKDGIDDRIHAGPGWDYDLALGNRMWGNWLGDIVYSPTEVMARKKELFPEGFYDISGLGDESSLLLSKLMFKMMDVPEFRAEVERVFRERLSGRELELEMVILRDVEKVRMAAKADGERWDKSDFDAEAEYLLDWVRIRYEHSEQEYGDGQNVKLLL